MGVLSRRTAIITGASSGVGRAAARLFAAEGAAVVLGARRAEALAGVAEAIVAEGGRAAAVPGDVRDEAFARALVETALDEFGRLDVAFNNAGTLGALGPAETLSGDAWAETLAVNLTGAFLGAKHQIPALRARGGALMFTSSFVGCAAGFPGMAAYAASKAGLVGLTQALAVELGPAGVRVNALVSGGVDTPMAATFAPSPDARRALAQLYPLGRLAQAEEIARAALYLASDASSFMTGAAMVVDGGVSVQRGV